MLKIDLRSDTVTRPSEAMRQAMANAQVGDDVFGEDPTVNRLQEKAAEILGKEAALYVPSGTMANQVSLAVHANPGHEVICESWAHCFRFEGAAGAAVSGLSFFPLPGRRGIITAAQVAEAVQAGNVHYPVSRLVTIENSHNRGNGAVYPLSVIREIKEVADANGLAMHLDGARMFNACLAGGYEPAELAASFDTVSFCLSKGLGAPVGSMVVGGKELIAKALRIRKRLGGGMRQAGILAAAGLYALENNRAGLADDHRRAKRLAAGLAELKGAAIDPADVETNIVIFDVAQSGLSVPQAVAALAEKGVGVVPFGGSNLRAVTHLDVNDADIEEALKVFAEVLG